MPHKHTRREQDPSAFDLPPSQIARPLPVQLRSRKALANNAKNTKNGKNGKTQKTENDGVSKKRKGRSNDDDAPRAFKRIMSLASGRRQRSGLDNGETVAQKKKAAKKAAAAAQSETKAEETGKPEMPTIRPGEKMSDFAARVNAALPLANLVNKTERGGKDPLGLKTVRTRKEKKMHKLYDQWREEERKIQEKREEELEEIAERELDEEINGGTFGNFGQTSKAFYEPGQDKKKGKKGKKSKGADREEDPWAVLKKMRAEAKVGLHDVAQAPPELHKAGRDKLLVRGAAVDVSNVPKSAGSLRRREELQETREAFLVAYRKQQEEKLAKLAVTRSRDTQN
ncbi:hypothetical protein CPAR01_08779 [Colletotrichum paranaense]|uniref:Urease accessory protein n=3 Tax=Colletotrichum acutatum species complex TaxID=2707335 RepID=A0AAI9XNA3_9PEZI|nr:uncharacterized protein CPAR01_08779 [Colletotrichum paranaense]KAK0374172.1 hypothetical protein CLIM01_08478 [Colletotrichum limetticola]KAK1454200.1 hypothetical protein CMEL01_05859 [Colletotrichum melonis]KAK1538666.1 hypothetical protein CPAR01_08779 [Colletotrichum paranaense]